jgi:hypothetical protein
MAKFPVTIELFFCGYLAENHPLNIHSQGKPSIRAFPQEHGDFVANLDFFVERSRNQRSQLQNPMRELMRGRCNALYLLADAVASIDTWPDNATRQAKKCIAPIIKFGGFRSRGIRR